MKVTQQNFDTFKIGIENKQSNDQLIPYKGDKGDVRSSKIFSTQECTEWRTPLIMEPKFVTFTTVDTQNRITNTEWEKQLGSKMSPNINIKSMPKNKYKIVHSLFVDNGVFAFPFPAGIKITNFSSISKDVPSWLSD